MEKSGGQEMQIEEIYSDILKYWTDFVELFKSRHRKKGVPHLVIVRSGIVQNIFPLDLIKEEGQKLRDSSSYSLISGYDPQYHSLVLLYEDLLDSFYRKWLETEEVTHAATLLGDSQVRFPKKGLENWEISPDPDIKRNVQTVVNNFIGRVVEFDMDEFYPPFGCAYEMKQEYIDRYIDWLRNPIMGNPKDVFSYLPQFAALNLLIQYNGNVIDIFKDHPDLNLLNKQGLFDNYVYPLLRFGKLLPI